MNHSISSPAPSADSASGLPRTLWDDYRKLLLRQHVKPNAARWYVRRVEHFVQRHRTVPLDQLAAADFNAHLEQTLRDGKLVAWQAVQTVDALQQFCNLCSPNSAGDVDWEEWRRAARSLPDDRAHMSENDIRQIKEDAADSRLVRKASPKAAELINRLTNIKGSGPMPLS